MIAARVTPRGGRDGIGPGKTADSFSIRVAAAPVDGAANAAVVALIARAFGVPRRDVTIISGEGARVKRIAISGDGQALAEIAATLYGAGA